MFALTALLGMESVCSRQVAPKCRRCWVGRVGRLSKTTKIQRMLIRKLSCFIRWPAGNIFFGVQLFRWKFPIFIYLFNCWPFPIVFYCFFSEKFSFLVFFYLPLCFLIFFPCLYVFASCFFVFFVSFFAFWVQLFHYHISDKPDYLDLILQAVVIVLHLTCSFDFPFFGLSDSFSSLEWDEKTNMHYYIVFCPFALYRIFSKWNKKLRITFD